MIDPAPHTDRRKTVHRDPHAEADGRNDGRHRDIQINPQTTSETADPDRRRPVHQGQQPTNEAADPDRRKIIHQDPQTTATGDDGTGGRGVGTITDDLPSRDGDSHGSVSSELPDARRQRAETLGGIEATAEERRAAAEMDDPGDGDDRGVGTHITASGEDPGSTDGSGGRGVGTAPVMERACRSTGHLSTDPAW